MTFLKFLAFTILGYYLLKFLFRLLSPWLMRYAARKTEEHFKRQFGQAGEPEREEGEISVEKPIRDRPRSSGKKVGEYIEFEEID